MQPASRLTRISTARDSVLHHEQITRRVGLDRDNSPVPGPVDFDDLATDQIVDEKCFRVFERNSHKQGATKLVGRLTGVNTLEFDQVPPLKGPELRTSSLRTPGATAGVLHRARRESVRQ